MRTAPSRRAVLLAALALPLAGAAQARLHAALAEAVNVAGRQRMLTQRIIKAFCQVGLGVDAKAARAQITEATARFETQLALLQAGASGATLLGALARVRDLWPPFKEIAAGPATREAAIRLVAMDDRILDATHRVVLQLEEASGTEIARLVNVSGRQRMLSQRLAKFHMMRSWGLADRAAEDEMGAAVAEFAGALQSLRAAPQNTDAIATALENVALQWAWFRAAIIEPRSGYEHVVAASAEAILGEFEAITAFYAALQPPR